MASVVLIAAGVFAVTGCHASAPAQPSPSSEAPASASATSGTAIATASTASAAAVAVPRQFSSRSVARLDIREGAVTSERGQLRPGNAYDVIALCSGADAVTYRLEADGRDVGGGSVRCGVPQRNSAVADASGELEVRVGGGQDGGADLIAHLEVIPAGTPWDPPSP